MDIDIFKNRLRKYAGYYDPKSLFEKIKKFAKKAGVKTIHAVLSAEGKNEERIRSIRIMLSLGVAPDAIAEKYGISADEVIRTSASATTE